MFAKSIVSVVLLGCLLGHFASIECAMTLEQMMKTATGIRNTCMSKTGTTLEMVDGLKNGQFPDDHNLQCYTQCVMKTIRTFKNGKIDVDMVLKQIDMMMPVDMQEGMRAATMKCSALEASADPCLTTYNYVKCNYNENPSQFFFP